MGDRRLRRAGWLGATLVVGVLAAPGSGRAQEGLGSGLLDGTPLCGVEAATSDTPPVADDGVLRVATFNVLHSDTADGDVSLGARLPLLADAIVDGSADIVGAQEVTRNVGFDPAAEFPQRHGLVAQRLAAAVADRTGQPWGWCWSLSNPHVPLSPDIGPGGGNPIDAIAAASGNLPDPGDFSEGLAILTRFPIEASAFRRLTPRSYEAVGCLDLDPFCPLNALFDSRQVLWARVAAPGGGVDMFTTHLAHTLGPLSDTTRAIQVQQAVGITAEWATADPLPDFLVGDFNSAPASAVMATTTAAGFVDTYRASGGPDCTQPGAPACSGGPTSGEEVFSAASQRAMSERIDYVLARSRTGCALEVPASEVLGAESSELPDGRWLWPSDHLGFVSSISCAAAAMPGDASDVAPSVDAGPPATDATSGRLPATGGPASQRWAAMLALLGLAVVMTRRAVRAHQPAG